MRGDAMPTTRKQAEEEVRGCLGRIISEKKVPVGLCFLVDPQHVITAAHVVAAALKNVDKHQVETPDEMITIVWPYLDDEYHSNAHTVVWSPRPKKDLKNDASDICILKLEKDAPSKVQHQKMVYSSSFEGHQFYAIGSTESDPQGSSVYGELREGPFDNTIMMDVDSQCRSEIDQGYSGGPVYDIDIGGVAGIVVQVKKGVNLARMVPVSVIEKVWDRLPQKPAGPVSEYQSKLLKGLNNEKDLQTILGADFRLSVDTGDQCEPVETLHEYLIDTNQRRAFLIGQAGGGKTISLRRILERLIQSRDGLIPVYINLKKWQERHLLEIIKKSSTDDTDSIINLLLRGFSAAKDTPYETLKEMSSERELLFIVDAFNEVHSSDARKVILEALDNHIFNNNGRDFVVIASRSEPLRSDSWKALRLCEVDEGICCDLLTEKDEDFSTLTNIRKRMVKIPFFLQIALSEGTESLTSRSKAIERFMINEIGLNKTKLDYLCRAVFEIYQHWKSQSIPEDRFKAQLVLVLSSANGNGNSEHEADDIISSLKRKSVLQEDTENNGYIVFDHQLRPDYLASRFLSLVPALESTNIKDVWKEEVFDKVTFDGISEDVLIMALEQLEDTDDTDNFLERVYDWSWKSALSCVTSRLETGEGELRPVDVAITMLVAQKCFDEVPHTRETAKRELNRLPDKIRNQLLKADSITSIIELIPNFDNSPKWYFDWFDFFTKKPVETSESTGSQSFTEYEIRKIVSEHSIKGWSASNVLKRFQQLDPKCQLMLRSFYYAKPPGAVRWRIVHALGSFPEPKNIELIKDAILSDSYWWVQYGAGRSLIECAAKARDTTTKQEIAYWIKQHADKIKNSRVRQEIARTLLITRGDDWQKVMKPVMDRLFELSLESEKEDWINLKNEFFDKN
jgi:hypothetical protein